MLKVVRFVTGSNSFVLRDSDGVYYTNIDVSDEGIQQVCWGHDWVVNYWGIISKRWIKMAASGVGVAYKRRFVLKYIGTEKREDWVTVMDIPGLISNGYQVILRRGDVQSNDGILVNKDTYEGQENP